ncbi:C1 family peptidase, partial [Saprospiraceae bacterium]|nr:C1 family peptidase [Saprospiraceae bacterium]
LILSITLNAQYEFSNVKEIDCSPVKNQSRTGTCWSFATASFIESELMRMGRGKHDLSEMFVVRNIYKDKAMNYLLRQGKANFSQGSLSHDLIRMMKREGVIPESIYSGLLPGENNHNHSEMEVGLKGFMDGVMKSKNPSAKWKPAFEGILDAYMGACPKTFEYNGKQTDAKSLANDLGIDADEYVSLTSFTHHPFYEKFILEIPDNYSNGSFYNIPLDVMMNAIDAAVDKGYTIAWDGDVSEPGFDAKSGIAVLPVDGSRDDLFTMPGEELVVNQELRQEKFENFTTTDDHLMHIVGSAKDQNGTKYYIIKNSWGPISPYEGYLYMSESYVAMKTISVMLHQDVLSPKLKEMVSEE